MTRALAKKLGLKRGLFSKYMSKVLYVDWDSGQISWYDCDYDCIRIGMIVSQESDGILIKPDDSDKVKFWPTSEV